MTLQYSPQRDEMSMSGWARLSLSLERLSSLEQSSLSLLLMERPLWLSQLWKCWKLCSKFDPQTFRWSTGRARPPLPWWLSP